MQLVTKTLFFSTLLSLPIAACAAESAAPTLASVLKTSGITVTGFIDTTYSALSGSGKYVGGSLNDRVFDTQRNGFLLNSANLTVSKLPSEAVGGLVNLTLGSDADIIASYGTIDADKGTGNGADQFFDVTEAYLSYGHGSLTLIGGKFNTLAGAEVIKGTNNSNISRSILFGYEPYTHTGIRSTYKVNEQLSLIAGINNGWDNVKDTNQQKTVELGVSYTPLKTFTLAVQGYSGKEQLTNYPLSSTGGLRNLVDIVATYNATDKLTFIINGDYGTQENANLPDGSVGTAIWQGVAAYANYQFTDQWRTSLRAEYFDDKDGYRTVIAPGNTTGQKQKEATFTVAYSPVKNAEFRGEVRHDFSDQEVFEYTNGTAKDEQNSVAFEAIYKF